MTFADLHLHTYFSDGTLTPLELVREAKKAGLACIAVTDHDTTEALEAAWEAAGTDIEVLSGVELTAEAGGEEIHILGYLFDHRDHDFLRMLKQMREVRVRRVYGICEKLKEQGVDLAPEDVFALAGGGCVGRLHIARALQKRGFVGSTVEAFIRYIGDQGPAYVGKFKMTPKEAIDWILRVKGVPVLAHPRTLRNRGLIADFVKDGLMGLEACYPEHALQEEKEFTALASKFGLLVTGGSDCHGLDDDKKLIGKIRLPYERVERLKEAQCALR